MKLPIIRQAYKNATPEELTATLSVLEAITEARGVTDEEMNVIGELITNICGALEVHQLVKDGKRESEALNVFAQKVIGSVDKI
ncbi:MAG TPA: hypothetical protein VLZ83_00580 [Edaphocola sp.]|nr:hypothetical protein [Edaphocola sp.]